ncbi:copper chaperone PCu(A)C [Chelativorans xinjiangense]|uniref:copper chaperone PCu(A)C n=1 Tax=Chelativorans xinjiangense TaxID=2681485 RepID=UPI00135BD4BF|nr:copper chaperone PCu(A)C [Chelativorans xinjiangense]
MQSRKLAAVLAVILSAMMLLPVAAHDHGARPVVTAAGVEVRQAWSPASVPGVNTRSVYFELINGSAAPLVIIGAESPGITGVAIHETSTAGGLTSMATVEQLTVPPGQRVSFSPQGLHLMLTGAEHHRQGELLPLRLLFADGTSLFFEAPVRKASGQHQHHRYDTAIPKS